MPTALDILWFFAWKVHPCLPPRSQALLLFMKCCGGCCCCLCYRCRCDCPCICCPCHGPYNFCCCCCGCCCCCCCCCCCHMLLSYAITVVRANIFVTIATMIICHGFCHVWHRYQYVSKWTRVFANHIDLPASFSGCHWDIAWNWASPKRHPTWARDMR